MMHPLAFWSLAAVVVVSAILVVTLRNIFHAGLALIVTFVGVAGVYLALRADFLAVMQILIYAGAIAVLILFAILMTHRVGDVSALGRREPVQNSLKVMAALVVLPLAGLLWMVLDATFRSASMAPPVGQPVLARIGERLLQAYALPFELVSVVLLAAMIGAIIVAREDGKPDGEEREGAP